MPDNLLYKALVNKRRQLKRKLNPVRKMKPMDARPVMRKPQVSGRGGGLHNQKRIV